MAKLTPFGKILIVAGAVGALWGIKHFAYDQGMVFSKTTYKSQSVGTIDLPTAPANAASTVPALPLPSAGSASVSGSEVRFQVMAWNAQMGLMYANGGITPTQGSLMAKNGVNLKLDRQDDCNVMQQQLIKFASEYGKNPGTREGVQMVSVMGDGSAAFLAGLNKELVKLGPDYKAVVVGSCGFSFGEDKFMGLPSWRANPQSAKGALVSCVIRDGDWNIVVKWAGDNGIPVNPDEKTYDPGAINFLNAPDYVAAANLYVAGKPETRDVVVNGVRTGEKKNVNINGVATWTPADVTVAEQKGGLVTIASTREYASQMPSTIITISKWAKDNRQTVVNLLDAISKGGDQVKCYSAALGYAGDASARVYKEKDGAYWVRYYKGESAPDKQGLNVELGGSKANNLADQLTLFGIAPGSTNTFKIVYNTFGSIVSKLYPDLVPTYPVADDIMDLSYLQELSTKTGTMAVADTQHYNAAAGMTQKVSEKAWSIEFNTGSAQLSPRAEGVLNEIANSAIVSSGLVLKIEGHTDNAGNPAGNQTLSEARANAVKVWLQSKYSNNFPSNRMTVVGKGQSEPVADNSSEAGRSKNRRVVIVMGK